MNLELINNILQIAVYISMGVSTLIWMYLFRNIVKRNISLQQRIDHLEYQLWKRQDKNEN